MITVRLPDGFTDAHRDKLQSLVAGQHGDDYELSSIDWTSRKATFVRRVEVVSVADDVIELPRHLATAAMGDRVATMIAEHYPGMVMVEFDPHRAIARFAELSEDERTARDAVAGVFGAKPWEVGVRARDGGGFVLTRLPKAYTPSRHDVRLAEVAETKVPGGRPGWFVRVDGVTNTGEIVPADLPTFPPLLPYDMRRLTRAHRDLIPVGRDLPAPGKELGEEFHLDFTAGAFGMVAGLPGGGKSVALNGIIAGSLAGGAQLVIVDTPDKAVDFLWCRDFVRDGGWGCESLEAAAAALGMMYEEGQRRAKTLRERGATNWLELPPAEQFTPILAVIDEYAALVTPERIPSGLPKGHALRLEVEERNYHRALIERAVSKIMAEMRFTGLRMVVSSQVANNSTGLGPSQKTKMGHRILAGANPSRAARTQAFNDEMSVPNVPGNVREDAAVSRGTGLYESEGRAPAVFKSYFARADQYRDALIELKSPRTTRPEPTEAEIAKYVPSMDGDDFPDDGPVASKLDAGGWGEQDGRDRPDPVLRGAAKAAHDLRVELGGA